jgi:hypothetical protein
LFRDDSFLKKNKSTPTKNEPTIKNKQLPARLCSKIKQKEQVEKRKATKDQKLQHIQ